MSRPEGWKCKIVSLTGVGIEFEPTDSGKKKLSLSASMFEFDTDKQTVSRKESIKPGTGGRFIDHETVKYTKEEVDTDIREGDFFSFRDQAILREQEMPVDDRWENFFVLFPWNVSLIKQFLTANRI